MDVTHQVHFGVRIPRDAVLEERILQFDFIFETLNNIELQQLKKSIPLAAIQDAVRDETNPCKLTIHFKGNRPYVQLVGEGAVQRDGCWVAVVCTLVTAVRRLTSGTLAIAGTL